MDIDEDVADPLDQVSEPATDLGVAKGIDLMLRDFAGQIGEPLPRAGGGSVAAYAGPMAAALVAMVCRLTVATKGVEAVEVERRPTCAAAETPRAWLLTAVEADTEAYPELAGAYHLPKDS